MMRYKTIEGNYLRDLIDQPNALRRTLALSMPSQLSDIAALLFSPNPPMLILTGMGSSFHALHPLAIRLAESGLRATMIETSEFIYYWTSLLGANTVVVAVSQSGRSAEIVRLLELNAGRSRVIGVTNDLASPLGRIPYAVVAIDAGIEATVSCKTYLCTLLALNRLADELCGAPGVDNADLLPEQVAQYFSTWQAHVEEAHEVLADMRHFVLAGRGSSLATTGTGGLITKEAARFPAEGMSSAAFRHGPLEMVNPHLFLLVFRGHERVASLNERLVAEVASYGGRSVLVSDRSESALFRTAPASDSLRPILEILPVQIITLALAARQGFEAGAFTRAAKITASE